MSTCIISDHHGVYIPQFFAKYYLSSDALYGVSIDDYETLLAGPDEELYWDAWDNTLQNFVGPNGETLFQDGDLFLLEWNDLINEKGKFEMVTYFMNLATGSVDTEENWRELYEESTPEEWGGEDFEDAGLVEVRPNVKGQNGYNSAYGDWRPVKE